METVQAIEVRHFHLRFYNTGAAEQTDYKPKGLFSPNGIQGKQPKSG